MLAKRGELFPAPIILAAQEAQAKTGCWAAVTLSQFALESGYGEHVPHGSNNFFGIKWYPGCPYGYVESATREFSKGGFHAVMAKFVAFPSIEACFEYHAHLLTNPKGPYYHWLAYLPDMQKWIQRIGPTYATLPNYSGMLIELIEQWKLDDFNLKPNK